MLIIIKTFFSLEPESTLIYLAHENYGKGIYKCIIRDTEEQSFILCDFWGNRYIVTQKKYMKIMNLNSKNYILLSEIIYVQIKLMSIS